MLGKISPLQAEPAPAPVPAAAVFVTPTFSALDKDVQFARDAFERRDTRALAGARDRFGSAAAAWHPLHQYVQYWWLAANLAQAGTFAVTNAGEISAFLKANPNSVVGDSLRRD